MARVFTDGAEFRDTLFFNETHPARTIEVQSDAPYASPYYYAIPDAGYGIAYISAISECYARIRFKVQGTRDTNLRVISFCSGSTELAYIGSDGMHFKIVTATGTTDTDLVIVLYQWYLIEVYFKLADNPDGRMVVNIDGIEYLDFTGDTKPGADTTFNRIYYAASGGYYTCFDDLALNDTSGGSDNSWCGDGIVIKVTPNEDGAHNDWTGNDADKVDNYLLVDDFPKDNDTTYVYAPGASSGTQDQYSLSDYDGTGKTILRIYPEARAKKTEADGSTIKIGILPSGGADQLSSAKDLTLTYARIVGDDYLINPVDSGAWEEADIDALEGIIEIG